MQVTFLNSKPESINKSINCKGFIPLDLYSGFSLLPKISSLVVFVQQLFRLNNLSYNKLSLLVGKLLYFIQLSHRHTAMNVVMLVSFLLVGHYTSIIPYAYTIKSWTYYKTWAGDKVIQD